MSCSTLLVDNIFVIIATAQVIKDITVKGRVNGKRIVVI
ncbi:hypothetical protein NVIRPANT_00652 [Pantoea sp. Nvir]|nr:hypothetical protein NVIRPANT_00652 [Pantoea sp. Nvir]